MSRLSSAALLLLLALLALVAALPAAHARRPIARLSPSAGDNHAALQSDELNSRPIIGIVSLANSDEPNETQSYIPASYVKWLEQAGARIAVIPFNAPPAVTDKLFAGLNGLLFTGGGLSLDTHTVYWKQAQYLWNKAIALNDAGNVFPIWGSCQGFQLMHLLAAQPADHEDILKCEAYDSTNLPLPLNMTQAALGSKLFGPAQFIPALMDGSSMKPTLYDVFATHAITQNLHNCGVHPDDFARDPLLPSFFKVLSTNHDLQGKPFVSTIEGVKYPFWAAQWHAERTQFEWSVNEKLAHTAESIAAHSYVAQRWMMLARQSKQRYATMEEETANLIYQFPVTFNGNNPRDSYPSQQIYKFDFKY